MQEHNKSIYVRVTPAEREQIRCRAGKCGLSVCEYIRQRCLGYAPREIPPEAYYTLCRKLEALRRPGTDAAILAVLDELRETLVEPGRDG